MASTASCRTPSPFFGRSEGRTGERSRPLLSWPRLSASRANAREPRAEIQEAVKREPDNTLYLESLTEIYRDARDYENAKDYASIGC